MTLATPDELDAFAATVEATPSWSLSMNQQRATMIGKTVSTTDAFDSIFRLRPFGWRIGMGENPVDPFYTGVELYQWDGWHPQGCVVIGKGQTMLLALITATARCYAARIRCAGNKPSLGVIMVASHVMVRTAGLGGLPPVGTITQILGPAPNAPLRWQLMDGSITDESNLCEAITA